MPRFYLPFLLSIHLLSIRFFKPLFHISRPRIHNWIFLMLILVSFFFFHFLQNFFVVHILGPRFLLHPPLQFRISLGWSLFFNFEEIVWHWLSYTQLEWIQTDLRRDLGSVSLSCPRNTILHISHKLSILCSKEIGLPLHILLGFWNAFLAIPIHLRISVSVKPFNNILLPADSR